MVRQAAQRRTRSYQSHSQTLTGKKGVKRKMLKSNWFASVIQVKLKSDFNILRLTPFLILTNAKC